MTAPSVAMHGLTKRSCICTAGGTCGYALRRRSSNYILEHYVPGDGSTLNHCTSPDDGHACALTSVPMLLLMWISTMP